MAGSAPKGASFPIAETASRRTSADGIVDSLASSGNREGSVPRPRARARCTASWWFWRSIGVFMASANSRESARDQGIFTLLGKPLSKRSISCPPQGGAAKRRAGKWLQSRRIYQKAVMEEKADLRCLVRRSAFRFRASRVGGGIFPVIRLGRRWSGRRSGGPGRPGPGVRPWRLPLFSGRSGDRRLSCCRPRRRSSAPLRCSRRYG